MYHTILGTENGKRLINNLVIKSFYAQLSVFVTQHEKVRFKRIPNLSTFSHYVASYFIDSLRIFVCLLAANKTYCIYSLLHINLLVFNYLSIVLAKSLYHKVSMYVYIHILYKHSYI